MKLRTKITLFIITVALLTLASTYLTSQEIFLDQFTELDQEALEGRMSDIIQTYELELQGMQETMLNYSIWDETYDYVSSQTFEDPQNPYILSNYDEETFKGNRFDLMALTNGRGNLVYSGLYDSSEETVTPVTPEIVKLFGDIREQLDIFTESENSYTGLAILNNGPMLMTFQPVIHNDMTGPVAGMAVAGRMLDDTEIGRIGVLSPSGITVENVSDGLLKESRGQKIWVSQLPGDRLSGHAIIDDLFGNPGIVISMEQPRHIYQIGKNAMTNFTLFFIISTFGICMLSLLFVKHTILSRMTALVRSIRIIGKSRDLSIRLDIKGGDELSEVEGEFNRMISSLETAQVELHRQAMVDPLTQLPNRALFFQTLNRTIRKADRQRLQIVLLFIDLDYFKTVNDTWGHDFGDAVLKQIAGRLTGAVGPDDLVSRLGGDEFIILLSRFSGAEDIQARISAIQRVLAEPHTLNGQLFHCTASIGVSIYPQNGEDAELLVKAADLAMFQVKENGRNNLCRYSEELEVAFSRKKVIGRQLLSAADNGELEVHYQPILSASTLDVVKVEALLRWTSPTFGPVSPAEFIPLAEAGGSILGIGNWVLRKVCADLRSFRDEGIRLKAAVNISGVQLMQPGLPEQLTEALADSGLTADSLELEITETVLMSDEDIISSLINLRSMGFCISLDDFGTGFSSLSYLRTFPVDLIKIDRSFVASIQPGASDDTLVRAIIELSHNLGLRVVSEGVELREQFDLLCALGSDQLQGYFISRPLPASALKEFISGYASAASTRESSVNIR